ncbi:hypothetical protein EON64_12380 [archaeon]|nr:MAG: hypothetical protein EON64_12380 [archaeon]
MLTCHLYLNLQLYQRPIPSGAQDIGTWQAIFQFISVAGVVTNAGLVCFTMNVLDDYDVYGRSWIFIGFQWTLIGVQFIIEQLIPDVPEEAETQEKRNDFIVSKIIDKKPDEEAVPVSQFQEWNNNRMNTDDDADRKGEFDDFKVQNYPAAGFNMVGNPMV